MQEMAIVIEALTLECRKSREVIEFGNNMSFFHGEVGTGKSSIARLVDFCLGGSAERTPAIQRELLSVSLTAKMGVNSVLFERDLENSGRIRIVWQSETGEGAQVSAPIAESETAIWQDAAANNLYNVNDMIYYLFNVHPPKVRKNKHDPDADLIRLGFRDIMWYCYLLQEEMESSFFHLDERGGFRRPKSRDVNRFILGFRSDRLNELEINLDKLVDNQRGKINAAAQIQVFLSQHGLGTIQEIELRKRQTIEQLERARTVQVRLRRENSGDTHFADQLRSRLRELSSALDSEKYALSCLTERIDQQTSLKAELIVTKFKLARTNTAATVLTGAVFANCPNCGTPINERILDDDKLCRLCLQVPLGNRGNPTVSQATAIDSDLDSRIEEIQDALRRHHAALEQQEKTVAELARSKSMLDQQLLDEVSAYDSIYLARFREIERDIATLEERLLSINNLMGLPESVARLRDEANKLTEPITQLRADIEAERTSFGAAEEICEQLERQYLQALLAVKFPDIGASDEVHIDRNSWQPWIYPDGDKERAWWYGNTGSGGKKTMLKVCYALAYHLIAADYMLPLPSLLIIDSPMKNISTQINNENYTAFYAYLMQLASGPLNSTQFIIIDNEHPSLVADDLSIVERKLTLTDPEHPPLISYYHGE